MVAIVAVVVTCPTARKRKSGSDSQLLAIAPPGASSLEHIPPKSNNLKRNVEIVEKTLIRLTKGEKKQDITKQGEPANSLVVDNEVKYRTKASLD